MSDQQQSATHRMDPLPAFGALALLYFVGYYLLMPTGNWWFQSETVVVEKTIYHAPWYVDAATPAMLLLIVGVILWGMQGGFPRP